jgi:hypothetical protein
MLRHELAQDLDYLLGYVKGNGSAYVFGYPQGRASLLGLAVVSGGWALYKVTYSADLAKSARATEKRRQRQSTRKVAAPNPISMYDLQQLHKKIRQQLPDRYQTQFLGQIGLRKSQVLDNVITLVTFFDALYGKHAHRRLVPFQDFLDLCRKTPKGVERLRKDNAVFHGWLVFELGVTKPRTVSIKQAKHLLGVDYESD